MSGEKRLYRTVLEKLQRLIDEGEYPPGGRLPPERELAKRFKVTGSGKVLRRRQGKRHLNRRKNSKRLRRLGQAATVAECDAPNIKADMPFAKNR